MQPTHISLISLVLILLDTQQAHASILLDESAVDEQWSQWRREHNKAYMSDDEHDRRRAVWMRNLLAVMQHNVNYDLGLTTYSMRLNVHSDLSWDEFRDRYANGIRSDRVFGSSGRPFNGSEVSNVPDSVDWREHGLVREVKQQGACGSCWAFSATGAIEGQYAKKYSGSTVEFSEQQLVDCSRTYGNHGCQGGLMELAFQYLETFGLEEERVYPYHAHNEKCHYDGKKAKVEVRSFDVVHSGDELALKAMVASRGPVSVAVDADYGFQHYHSGIYQSRTCSSTRLTHGVLAVGYGVERGSAFWIIKNSWGPEWGEHGYIRLARNRRNMCGVATMASVPQLV